MTKRLGLVGLDSSHAEDILRLVNRERRWPDLTVSALHDGAPERIAELRGLAPEAIVAPDLAALIASVDAVVVGHRHGDRHRAAAVAALAAGRPVFVDKPLANSVADAEAIVAAAGRTGTPLFSGSALRWQAETLRLKARLAGLDGGFALSAHGTWYPQSEYGGAISYAIHTIELVQALCGPGWRDLRRKADDAPLLGCRIGEAEVTLEFRPLGPSGSSDFGVAVAARKAKFQQAIPLGDDYMAPVIERLAAMLRSGESPMTDDDLVSPIRMMAAIRPLLGEAA